MFEAVLKNVAVQPEKGHTVLYAAFEYLDGGCGVKAKYNWFDKSFDKAAFIEELKESVAKELEIETYKVVFDERKILDRMEKWAEKFAKLGFLIHDGGLYVRGKSEGFIH